MWGSYTRWISRDIHNILLYDFVHKAVTSSCQQNQCSIEFTGQALYVDGLLQEFPIRGNVPGPPTVHLPL